jgi:hypothetical protein
MTTMYAGSEQRAVAQDRIAPTWWGRGAILILLFAAGPGTVGAQIGLNYLLRTT